MLTIDIQALLSGVANRLTFSESADFSTLVFYGVQLFPRSVLVEGEIVKAGGLITLTLSLSAEADGVCSRCGGTYPLPFFVSESFSLARSVRDQTRDDILLYDGPLLDLTEAITDLLVLNVDMQPLCTPDCKGVCSGCGTNLNEGVCRCTNK